MTFLNFAILLGLGALAIPIVIHLLNRRKAQSVAWGAMRFLSASLAVRSRRVKIEEIALLALRCMVVALAVLAVARPLLPTRPTPGLVVVVASVPIAVVLAAAGAASWSNRNARVWLLASSAGVLLLGPAAAGLEHWVQARRWDFAAGSKDVAIVIDGSMSMTLPAPSGGGDGETNFDRAVAQTRAVIASCGPGDGVSVILAGAVPRTLVPLTSDHQQAAAALDTVQPPGGSMRAAGGLQAAIASLATGGNPAKKIIVITDAQRVGWEPRNTGRWRRFGAALNQSSEMPEVIVSTLPVRTAFRNLAVTQIEPGGPSGSQKARLIGMDRAIGIDVRVQSTGTEPVLDGRGGIAGASVSLLVDGNAVSTQPLSAALGGANAGVAEVVHFSHRFAAPGRHLIGARLDVRDDLAGDNELLRAVDVRSSIGVLIVDGSPSLSPLGGAADFIDAALSATPKDAGGRSLLATTVVAAPDAAGTFAAGLDQFSAVVLADVPALPHEAAKKLARFVAGGGGLLIVPGPDCRPAFYEAWRDDANRPVTPAKLAKWQAAKGAPARLSPTTFTHPALAGLAAAGDDLGRGGFSGYWRLVPTGKAGPGAQLDTGEPLLVSAACGRGRSMMLAGPMDPSGGNLPALNSFVPLLREMVSYLVEGEFVEPNGRLGRAVVVELSAPGGPGPDGSADGLFRKGQHLEVIAPSGATRPAVVASVSGGVRVRVPTTDEPGLHRLVLPPSAATRYAAMCPGGRGVPFVVNDPANESSLAMLTDADIQTVRRHVQAGLGRDASAGKLLVRVANTPELLTAVGGGIPGVELWRHVAVALVLALLAETAVGRWIAFGREGLPRADASGMSRRHASCPTGRVGGRREAGGRSEAKVSRTRT